MRKIILLSDASSSYARGLLKGIAEYSRLHGHWTFFRESIAPFYRETAKTSLYKRVKKLKAHGVIARISNKKFADEIKSWNLPVVAFDDDDRLPGFSQVISDSREIARLAADHLLNQGVKDFAFCGFGKYRWSRERGEHFQTYLEEKGFSVNVYEIPLVTAGPIWENEQVRVTNWLKTLKQGTGIFACNDDRAQQVLECAHSTGLYVPDKLSIIGVDNDSLLCGLSNPSLTSVSVDTFQAGYKAANLLDNIISDSTIKPEQIIARPTHVENRGSTEIFTVKDPHVVKALRYIRNNYRRDIGVENVVNAVSISRRSLFDKFVKVLGRTISQELKRVRIEHICKCLAQSNLPVSQIARDLHFTSIEHISRYFKSYMKINPVEYRRKFRRLV